MGIAFKEMRKLGRGTLKAMAHPGKGSKTFDPKEPF
jgi:hypothetical protein